MVWFWRLIRRSPPATSIGRCGCGAELVTCSACLGGWRDHRCSRCGLGARCPDHGSHWMR